MITCYINIKSHTFLINIECKNLFFLINGNEIKVVNEKKGWSLKKLVSMTHSFSFFFSLNKKEGEKKERKLVMDTVLFKNPPQEM